MFFFYCRLPSNIYYINYLTFALSSCVYKSSTNIICHIHISVSVNIHFSSTKPNGQYSFSNNSHCQMLLAMWVWESRYFQAYKDDILVRCKIRATFAPPTFEDKEKVANTQLWYNVLLPWYNLYQERKREIPHMNQTTVPPRHVWPLGTNTAMV